MSSPHGEREGDLQQSVDGEGPEQLLGCNLCRGLGFTLGDGRAIGKVCHLLLQHGLGDVLGLGGSVGSHRDAGATEVTERDGKGDDAGIQLDPNANAISYRSPISLTPDHAK